MSEPTLKACPFCGGPATACVGCHSIGVECRQGGCGVAGPKVYDDDRSAYPEASVALAAELWNERAGMELEARALQDKNDRLLTLRAADSWLETALLQLLHENGIEPSSGMLIEAIRRSRGVGFP